MHFLIIDVVDFKTFIKFIKTKFPTENNMYKIVTP